jgi:broad specificity phosphatase PhoE
MNHLKELSKLRNQYFGLRHGRSEAQEKSLLVSRPDVGIFEYDLVDEGRMQVGDSINEAIANGVIIQDPKPVIISSDFLRCRRTADIAASFIHPLIYTFDKGLRERYVGNFDLKELSRLNEIMLSDMLDADNKTENVESLNEIVARTTALIRFKLEKLFSDRQIILVSHGYPLDLIDAAFQKIRPEQHVEKIRGFKNAELREFVFNSCGE